jgi:hypothetical protein
MYIYRNSTVKKIKEGLTFEDLKSSGYFVKHPDAVVCNKPPSLSTLEKWVENGSAKAVDGCKVEPDGVCPHGLPSWLIVTGCI